jgi:hypothetical protein
MLAEGRRLLILAKGASDQPQNWSKQALLSHHLEFELLEDQFSILDVRVLFVYCTP